MTAAAFVMVGVFAVFATLQFLFFKQFGVGLAAAVLIDATIIRGVLLPATMTLLGERNWYLPALAAVAPPASGRGPARAERDRPGGLLNLAAPPPDPATAPGPGRGLASRRASPSPAARGPRRAPARRTGRGGGSAGLSGDDGDVWNASRPAPEVRR